MGTTKEGYLCLDSETPGFLLADFWFSQAVVACGSRYPSRTLILNVCFFPPLSDTAIWTTLCSRMTFHSDYLEDQAAVAINGCVLGKIRGYEEEKQ